MIMILEFSSFQAKGLLTKHWTSGNCFKSWIDFPSTTVVLQLKNVIMAFNKGRKITWDMKINPAITSIDFLERIVLYTILLVAGYLLKILTRPKSNANTAGKRIESATRTHALPSPFSGAKQALNDVCWMRTSASRLVMDAITSLFRSSYILKQIYQIYSI